MVVVMPYGHVPREIKTALERRRRRDMAAIEKELLTGHQAAGGGAYRVFTDRNHRAIGGLSMGAAQSLSMVCIISISLLILPRSAAAEIARNGRKPIPRH